MPAMLKNVLFVAVVTILTIWVVNRFEPLRGLIFGGEAA